MDSDSVRGIGRRLLLGWGGLAAGVAVGAPLAGAQVGHAVSAATDSEPSGGDRIPPGTLPEEPTGHGALRPLTSVAARGGWLPGRAAQSISWTMTPLGSVT